MINSNSQKRNSKGRSDYIENSVFLLESLFKNHGSIVDIQINMNNKTLPPELRSIAWRIFMQILPLKKSPKEWVSITMEKRKNYEKMLSRVRFLDKIENFIKGNQDFSIIETSNYSSDKEFINSTEYATLKTITSFLNNMSQVYDLFKNESIIESFVKIYLAYVLNNKLSNFSNAPFLHILSAFIYSLFPCIIHTLENTHEEIMELSLKNKLDSSSILIKDLFNFLNSELYFDHDVFTIFESFLNDFKHKDLILNLNSESIVCLTNDQEIEKINTKKLSLAELSTLMMTIQSPSLIEHMSKYKLNISTVFKYYVSTLYSSSFKLDDVSYLIDALLCNEEQLPNEEVNLSFISSKISFHFIYFIFSSLIISCSDELFKITDIEKFNNYLLFEGVDTIKDFKQIVIRALTNREAMSLIYSNN